MLIYSSSSVFSPFGVGASSFQLPRSPVLCFFSLYYFLLRVYSYNITPPQFRSSFISVSTQIPSSMFSLPHLLLTFCPHGLTISVSLLFVFINLLNTHAFALIPSFMTFSTLSLVIPIIHLNIIINVLDNKLFTAFCNAPVSFHFHTLEQV